MKKFSISIPKPCHENWEAMTTETQGRFCNSFQKTVIDFSGMSDSQLAAFFKKPASSLCGRFMPDQLDREIEIPKKRIPWVRYFFTIALPAFLVSCKFAGRQALKDEAQKTQQRLTGDSIMLELPVPGLVGYIVPQDIDSIVKPKQPTPLVIKPIKKCKIEAITKDSSGFADAPFQFQPAHLAIKDGCSKASASENFLSGRLGGFSVTRVSMKKARSVATISPQQSDSLPTFSVFPNPVTAGSVITLNVNSIAPGPYEISLMNSGGAMMQNTKIELSDASKQIQFGIKVLTAGTYFVVLADTKSGKHYTQKVIIQ